MSLPPRVRNRIAGCSIGAAAGVALRGAGTVGAEIVTTDERWVYVRTLDDGIEIYRADTPSGIPVARALFDLEIGLSALRNTIRDFRARGIVMEGRPDAPEDVR